MNSGSRLVASEGTTLGKRGSGPAGAGAGSTTIYCVRHGESESNVSGHFPDDDGNSPMLTERGKRQAAQAGEHLQGLGIEAVFASPMPRARQTAEYIARELGLKETVDTRLREVDLGKLSGRLYSETVREDPRWFEEYFNGGNRYGLEKFSAITARMLSLVRHIRDKGIGSAVLVSHLDPIRALVIAAMDAQSAGPLRNIEIGNASITILGYDGYNFTVRATNWLPMERYPR
ncbi:MAG: histidine phosphatase family protein [Nitrososphaerota archaeon]|nr:histidine phosphatase family protein [Nitrososphaerota archaeon]